MVEYSLVLRVVGRCEVGGGGCGVGGGVWGGEGGVWGWGGGGGGEGERERKRERVRERERERETQRARACEGHVLLHRPAAESMAILSQYDFVVIDEAFQLSQAHYERVHEMFLAAGKQTCVLLLGDPWQPPRV